jgi:hypothetical protein
MVGDFYIVIIPHLMIGLHCPAIFFSSAVPVTLYRRMKLRVSENVI